MKRGKKLLILLGVLVILCGIAVAAKLIGDSKTADIEEDSGEKLVNMKSEDLTAFSWKYTESVSLIRTDGVWSVEDDADFPVNETALNNIINAALDLTAVKVIENPNDMSVYGIDDPLYVFKLKTDTEVTVNIGDETVMGGQCYVSVGDGNVYIIDTDILETFQVGKSNILKKESLPDMDTVTSMTVQALDKTVEIVHLTDGGHAYSDDYQWFLKDGDSLIPLDTELTAAFAGGITGMSWDTCVAYTATDLSPYHLDTPEGIVTIAYTNEVDTGEKDEDGNAITEEESGTFTLEVGHDDDYFYGHLPGSGMVYTIESTVYNAVVSDNATRLLPAEVVLMDWDNVSSFDATLDGVTYTFTQKTREVTDDDGETESESYWELNGEEVVVSNITSALDKLESDDGWDVTQPTDGKQELALTVHQKSDAFPTVELVFYRLNGSTCVVSCNGRSGQLITRSDTMNLVEIINAIVLG